MTNAVANSWAFWIAIITVLAAVWASPIIIGLARHVQPIIVVILLCMFPILWPAALIGAFMLPRKLDRYRHLSSAPRPYYDNDSQGWRSS
jgi:hypothetical protein